MVRPTVSQSCNTQACEEEWVWFSGGSSCVCSSSCPWTYVQADYCNPGMNSWSIHLNWLAGYGPCNDAVYGVRLPLVHAGYSFNKGRDLVDLRGTNKWPTMYVQYGYNMDRNCLFSIIRKPI